MKRRNRVCMAGAGLALALSIAAQSASAQSVKSPDAELELDIAAQPVGDSLNAFAQQSGLQVIFFSEVAGDLEARAAVGEFESSEAALRYLLADTGLDFKFVNERTVAIQAAADGKQQDAIPGKSRPASNQMMMAQTSAQKSNKIEEQGEQSPKRQDRQIEEIVVTGTNIRGTTPASPLRVIDRAEIERTGVSTVGELLETLPQNFGGGFNEDAIAVSGSNSVVFSGKSTVNLRGLGAAATLVLFNGRRLASSGNDTAVDVSMIPLSAVERVEVLTDGASAIYGSDAVAGVVNFVTRRDYEGGETRLRAGTVTDGDLREYRVVQTFGKNWENSNLFASYQYYDRGDLQAIDRDFTAAIALDGATNRDDMDILPKQESHNLLVSGTHTFSDRLSVQGDFLFASRKANYERPFIPIAITDSKTEQYAATLATFFDIIDSWQLEVAGVFGFNEQVSNTIQPTVNAIDTIDTDSQLWSIDPKLTGTLFGLPGGSVGVAVGGQFREETYDRNNPENDGVNAEGDREIWSTFAEALVPIVGESNSVPGVRRLDLSLAVRHEDYSDFGTSTDPKFGVVWSPVRSLDIRGTWGTSFRAPNLDQLDFVPAERSAFFFDFPDPTRPDGITTALLEFSGRNNQLGPESSTAYTVGFDYRPETVEGLVLGATYFNVQYDDRIAQPTSSIVSAFLNRDIFASVIWDNPSVDEVNAYVAELGDPALGEGVVNFAGRPFDPAEIEAIFDDRIQNLAATDVTGIDFSASYRFETGVGDFGLSLDGSHTLEFVNKVTPTSPEDDVIDTFLHPTDWRLRAGIEWSKGGLSTAGFINHQDSYTNDVVVPETSISSWTTVDLSISYETAGESGDWLDNVIIGFNARNLFDQDPPFIGDDPALLAGGLARPVSYDPANASPLGRFVAFEIRKNW